MLVLYHVPGGLASGEVEWQDGGRIQVRDGEAISNDVAIGFGASTADLAALLRIHSESECERCPPSSPETLARFEKAARAERLRKSVERR